MQRLDLFDSFQDNLNEAERVYLIAQKNYQAAKKLRDDNCQHIEIFNRVLYYNDRYDYGYKDTRNECKCCGYKSEVKRERS